MNTKRPRLKNSLPSKKDPGRPLSYPSGRNGGARKHTAGRWKNKKERVYTGGVNYTGAGCNVYPRACLRKYTVQLPRPRAPALYLPAATRRFLPPWHPIAIISCIRLEYTERDSLLSRVSFRFLSQSSCHAIEEKFVFRFCRLIISYAMIRSRKNIYFDDNFLIMIEKSNGQGWWKRNFG